MKSSHQEHFPNDEHLCWAGEIPCAMASLHHAHLLPLPLSFSHAHATIFSLIVFGQTFRGNRISGTERGGRLTAAALLDSNQLQQATDRVGKSVRQVSVAYPRHQAE